MTDMERPAPTGERDDSLESPKMMQLRKMTTELFVTEDTPEPRFTYINEKAKIVATLTFDEALVICGPLIEAEGEEKVIQTLITMNTTEQHIRQNNPALYEKSLLMGQQIKNRHQG